jgi:hypothetical protein
MTSLFEGFYQLGFVARDLDAAIRHLGERYGVTRWRRKESSASMASAHAWCGAVMLELIAVGPGAPAIYDDYIPRDAVAARLHHHGYRVEDAARWADINRRMDASGLATDMRGAVMDGDLNYLYADTRADLGIYSEFVFLTGSALGLYDDVPRN